MLTNPKWEKFCLEYAKTGNASDAYRKAGYISKNPSAQGASARRLLQKNIIQKRLGELTEKGRNKAIADAAEIQEILTRIARQEQYEEVVVVEGIEKGVTEARIVTKRPSNADAVKAAQTLARMQGAFDLTVNMNVVPVFGGEDELTD